MTRTQQQERTRAAVLAAAGDEFGTHGFTDAKVDRIAERAELTRGAVYSNFPSKRALYLAVLLDQPVTAEAAPVPPGLAGAVETFARAWLERLPLVSDTPATAGLRLRSVAGVFDPARSGPALGAIARLEALLLGLALEAHTPGRRQVRLAELVLTLLRGTERQAETAAWAVDPFDVARACAHLVALDLGDEWAPPHLAFVRAARPAAASWDPPPVRDLLTGDPVALGEDGVVTVLGAERLEAAEEAVRAGDRVTVVAVTGSPSELGALIRLRVRDLVACLPGGAALPLHVVLDGESAVASALGVAPADDTEVAVRVAARRITARAEGRGAGHSAAVAR